MTSFLQVKINNIDLKKKIELILMFKLAVLLL